MSARESLWLNAAGMANGVSLPCVVGGGRVAGMNARDREEILLFACTWRVVVVMRSWRRRFMFLCWRRFTSAVHWRQLENAQAEMQPSLAGYSKKRLGE